MCNILHISFHLLHKNVQRIFPHIYKTLLIISFTEVGYNVEWHILIILIMDVTYFVKKCDPDSDKYTLFSLSCGHISF